MRLIDADAFKDWLDDVINFTSEPLDIDTLRWVKLVIDIEPTIEFNPSSDK